MNSESDHPDAAGTGLQQAITDRALERYRRERAPRQFWSAKLVVAIIVALSVAAVAGVFFDFFLKVLGRYFATQGVTESQPRHEIVPLPDTSRPNDKSPYMISVDPPAQAPQEAPAPKDSG